MLKDPKAFRERFARWKETGESQYEAGRPKYNGGKEEQPLHDYIERAVKYLAEHEGFIPHVYEDIHASQEYAKKHGVWSDKHQKWAILTAGYGWTNPKDLHNWTKEAADERLKKDIKEYDNLLRQRIPNYDKLIPEQKIALIDLYHQGGTNVFKKMPNLYAALVAGDIEKAGKQLSFGAAQTPNRNTDRLALWNTPQHQRNLETKQLQKEAVKYKTDPTVQAVSLQTNRKPIMPVKREYEYGVPDMLSIKNTFPTEAEQAMSALNAKATMQKIAQELSLEALDNKVAQQLQNEMGWNLFTNVSMPQYIHQ